MNQDKLEFLFEKQKQLVDLVKKNHGGRYPQGQENIISALCTAIIHEAVELQRLTSWKWWKQPVQWADNVPEAKVELTDIFFFVIHAFIEMGMTPEEIVEEYKKKHKINEDRQHSGY